MGEAAWRLSNKVVSSTIGKPVSHRKIKDALAYGPPLSEVLD